MFFHDYSSKPRTVIYLLSDRFINITLFAIGWCFAEFVISGYNHIHKADAFLNELKFFYAIPTER
ncbi:hypothetical protein PCURB6_02130 [Paenibacillus curdlanolyticus]|nr:hypothetical protein PCURB6_02130 [Paenibacillus curdlanolyticus]